LGEWHKRVCLQWLSREGTTGKTTKKKENGISRMTPSGPSKKNRREKGSSEQWAQAFGKKGEGG